MFCFNESVVYIEIVQFQFQGFENSMCNENVHVWPSHGNDTGPIVVVFFSATGLNIQYLLNWFQLYFLTLYCSQRPISALCIDIFFSSGCDELNHTINQKAIVIFLVLFEYFI